MASFPSQWLPLSLSLWRLLASCRIPPLRWQPDRLLRAIQSVLGEQGTRIINRCCQPWLYHCLIKRIGGPARKSLCVPPMGGAVDLINLTFPYTGAHNKSKGSSSWWLISIISLHKLRIEAKNRKRRGHSSADSFNFDRRPLTFCTLNPFKWSSFSCTPTFTDWHTCWAFHSTITCSF